MVAAEGQARGSRARVAHPEEWFSILMAVGIAVGSVLYFWLAPELSPTNPFLWAVPGWIAGAYLFLQILFLLVSATQIRALGVLDSVLAILPVVAGLVMVVEAILGHLKLSLFQLNVLGLLIATSLAEFLLTVWIRFVINRRTIGFGPT
jgi:asparagine N-glycosylation enzyme membrane subunit Stt3